MAGESNGIVATQPTGVNLGNRHPPTARQWIAFARFRRWSGPVRCPKCQGAGDLAATGDSSVFTIQAACSMEILRRVHGVLRCR